MPRKFIKQKKQNNDEMFNALVKNAIDFINSAFDDLDSRPKNSIVDFYTAIELFLKARLMREHWSLIISKPELANLEQFQEGDFHSVTLKGAIDRLNSIAGEIVEDKIVANFKALGEHRNQIVHFAHTDYVDRDTGKANVVIEQWSSWYYLHELLTEKWKEIFSPFKEDIESIHKRMMEQKEFLEARYGALTEVIEQKRREGIQILQCKSCGFESAISGEIHKWGTDYECIVCGTEGVSLKQTNEKLPCYNCGHEYEFFDKDIKVCPNCNATILMENLIRQCKKKYKSGDEWWEDEEPHIAYCHECEYPEPSVFYIDGLWSCVSCFDRGWQAVSCPHCGKFVTGDMERIKYFACHLCEDQQREER